MMNRLRPDALLKPLVGLRLLALRLTRLAERPVSTRGSDLDAWQVRSGPAARRNDAVLS